MGKYPIKGIGVFTQSGDPQANGKTLIDWETNARRGVPLNFHVRVIFHGGEPVNFVTTQ
jgi:hypothetical protein